MEIELSRLVDALPGLVWTTLPDGTSEYVNQRWREYAGLSLDDVRRDGWTPAIHPDDLPQAEALWHALIAEGVAGEAEVRLRRHDGAYRRFNVKTCPVTGADGRIVGWCGINTDIEDRRRAEEAMLAHERRFQFIIDGLPAIVALFTPQGRIAYCNKQMLDYLDETFEQVRAKASAYNFHPDDRDEVLAAWAASVRSGAPFDRDARLRRADGAYRWHRTRVLPLHNAEGEVDLWYGLSIDIEDTKRAEATLAVEKRLLERVAKGVPLNTVLDELSRAVEDLAPGCHCSVLTVQEDGARFAVGAGPTLPDSYNAILHGKVIDPRYGPCSLAVVDKTPIITADLANDPRWAGSVWPPLMRKYGLASCWSMPILSGAGKVLGVFAIYRRKPEGPTAVEQELIDRFTHIAGIAIERAQADAALTASEAQLRRANSYLTEAQRLSRTGSFTWDILADEHNWSDEIYRIFGFAPGARVTMPMIREAIHPEDLADVERVIGGAAQGADFDLVFRVINPDGQVRHAHVVGHRIAQIPDRPVFLGAIQDVTENRRAEEALNKARGDLARVSRVTALSALTASIAHEVNQPLAGIITNASTCLRMLAAEPADLDGARATAQRTIRDGHRASDVIQRLRSLFARKPPSMEPVDLNDAAREVLALSASELQRRRVVLRTDFAAGLPAVSGDRVQLLQVILNLGLNAADAMSDVEGRPRDLLVSTARDDPARVTLAVRDAGVGIAPPDLERLFDAFYTTKAEGMGIGLSVSRSIVQGHDGRLWATPNDGPGATFAFAIPCGPARPPVMAEADDSLRKAWR
jgi:PAS domain S-box-containing protein